VDELTVIIIVYVCGLLAMVAELFVPGAVMGMLGFLAAAGSITYAFVTGHNVAGGVLVACTLAFIPVFFLTWRHVVGRFFALKTQETDFHPSTTIDEALVGVEGVALTPLRPTGIAQLDGRRHHVVTRGEMLGKGSRITVIEVSGNRIVVRQA